jgi:prepilin signal peptidase PulO-like enzyme (type II secretory pathway)
MPPRAGPGTPLQYSAPMPAGRSKLRAPALMAVAAFALHQLRYVLAPAEPAGGLDRPDHAYLPFAATIAALLFAVAAGQLALRLARARDDGAGESVPPSFWLAWLAASAGLVAIFVVQELLESLLGGGAMENPLAGGGLWAVPLAMALAALVALGLRWAGEAVRAAVRQVRRRRLLPGPLSRPVWRPSGPRASVLARHLAGRAPPLAS